MAKTLIPASKKNRRRKSARASRYPSLERQPGSDGVRESAPEYISASQPGSAIGRHRINIDQVRKGLPLQALDDLATRLAVDRLTLADILGTSVRTLQRKAEGEESLSPGASDRLARIVRILELATHVFGEPDKASAWLTAQSRALENEIPLHLLDTDIGSERVQQELRQIEFGMPF